ncbi:hypothetical protein GCM10010222_62190 [Streptomyces tanashiensis]|nr:hypothetical protein GCM10010222_62190 [Streptomyces tanashiensis]
MLSVTVQVADGTACAELMVSATDPSSSEEMVSGANTAKRIFLVTFLPSGGRLAPSGTGREVEGTEGRSDEQVSASLRRERVGPSTAPSSYGCPPHPWRP